MKGGTILGEGGYGCVFQPPLQCKNKRLTQRNKNYISKLSHKKDATLEWKMAKKIDKLLPNNKEYVINWRSMCVPAQQQTDKSVRNCGIYKSFIKSPEDYLIIQARNGGQTLENKLTTLLLSINNSNVSGFKRNYIMLIKKLEPLFLGLYSFSNKKIVHNDIKEPNIVILESDMSSLERGVRFIDFGLSVVLPGDLKLLKQRAKLISEESRWYYPYPPEYLYSCITKKDLKYELDYQQYKEREYYNLIRSIHVDLIGTAKSYEEFDSIIEEIMADSLKKKTSKEYEKLFLKTDVYGLGISLIFLVGYYTEQYKTVSLVKLFNKDKGFIKKLRILLQKMMNLDYKKRISAKKAFNEYQKLIKNK